MNKKTRYSKYNFALSTHSEVRRPIPTSLHGRILTSQIVLYCVKCSGETDRGQWSESHLTLAS